MKKVVGILLVMFAVTGCKSLDSVRATKPVNIGGSDKSVNSFSSCVSGKLAGNGTPVTSLPLENGISILVPQAMGGYDVVLDVTENNGKTSYVLYERVPSMTSDSYEKTVLSCR
ncbi:hypothetical protein ACOTXZ_17690 [Enterobacter cloacae complex sp. LZL004]|uniref:hypothetical protein n=1 Tax=Enterobacter cloacae complex TaxID=354276 RepID=UPI000907D97F|nr:hypothetical protein [Enterobacter hormaechei]ASA02718.1 hypothetical protein AM432_02140 [Enterobacter cloacae complex sp.]EKY1715995.1 hypothetical protein [Enterobacter hormaechei]MBW7708224.1 hypothetical protein [Enterobacter hormaechei]MCE1319612.1 hypothetical protein [Enterobacter hormaechei]MCE1333764.1 hypothetical protein [Enterobacter hormaechei]